MPLLSRLNSFARHFFHRKRKEKDLDDELASTLELLADQKVREGMTPDEARRAARIELGGVEQVREQVRAVRAGAWLDTLLQDVRFGLRMLRKNPGFAAVAILTLALGIGANTAIFSVIDAVLLKMLPVQNPQQLILLDWSSHAWPDSLVRGFSGAEIQEGGNTIGESFSFPAYELITARNRVFSGVAAFAGNGSQLNVGYNGQPARADGELVSGTFFSTLGVQSILGRTLSEDDDRVGADPAALISYGYWAQGFGADPNIVGRSITVNSIPFTIVGVSAPGFYGVQPGRSVNVWLPLHAQPQVEPRWSPTPPASTKQSIAVPSSLFDARDHWWVAIIGRLLPDVSTKQANAALEVIFQQTIASDIPPDSGPDTMPHLGLQSGSQGLDSSRREFAQPLFILMVVVALVLLIACINIANLLLARGTSRQREIAVRLAVGARRTRLIRQLLTESVLLAGLGGIVGLAFAYWGTELLVALMRAGNESLSLNVGPDLHVFAFTAAISVLAGILFGLSPAFRSTRLELTPSLKESPGETLTTMPGKRGLRLHLGGALVIAQVALSLVVLVGAGLFVHTLRNLENVNPGFSGQNLLLFGIDPTQAGYEGQRLVEFYQELTRKIELLPGVRNVSISHSTLIGGGGNVQLMQIPRYTPRPGVLTGAAINWIGPNFFNTMQIPLVLGRDVSVSDSEAAPKVAVVNEQFVRQFLSGGNPVGRRVRMGSDFANDTEIVGVVRDVKFFNLREDAPATIYAPWLQYADLNGAMHFEVRTALDPTQLVSSVRRTAQQMDANLALYEVKSQVEQMNQSLFEARLFAQLTSFFGALAALLARVGLYGVMAFAVSRRTREIGIRIALGASRTQIVQMVLRNTFVVLGVGIGIGIVAALGASRLISAQLFGITADDPYAYFAVSGMLAAVALIACWIPARRAMRVDPMVALRHE